jgi:predicted Zn-dependent peptidase
VLVLAGDVSAAEAALPVEQCFAALPARTGPDGGAAPGGDPRQDASSLRVPGLGGVQAHVAWAVPGFGQPGWYVASILLRGLVAGRSCPLARDMIHGTGLAQEIGGRLVTMRDTSTLVVLAAAARDIDCRRLEQGLADAIDRLLASGLSAAALDRVRRKALRDHYLTIQKLDRRADLCASLTSFLDAPERLEDEPRRYASVDEDAIAALASELRDRPARVALTLVPRAEAA